MMKEGQAKTTWLKDYTALAFSVETIDLRFELGDEETRVTSTMRYQRQVDAPASLPLRLYGEELELLAIKIDGEFLAEKAYEIDESGLTLFTVPDAFSLEIMTQIYPQNNTALEGLYMSGGKFCTQCEAEGFRKITYYPDRPDVMAVFTTTVIADKQKYPVLLSNGNLQASGEVNDELHYATWHDPYPKPAYLFALVAGDLESVEGQYTTLSGRDVRLKIYTEAHNIDQCDHALGSLKRAMQWDEERFGLEYDLDIYMIVAVDDFNMGAMENKGLNIFNSKLVFARPDTATDTDYINIEAVIGHEYFHNWTGNRVTCRDWFQLSLKEGLTVFRDQEFTADLHSRTVKRIDDVRALRTWQFAEDASPMAHPVRPASYMEINNFYTVTVYEKGAEVVRMYQTLLGREGFRKGMDLYFQRHDGQAVTTEDFLAAMADANNTDLSQFQRWYDQAGTPLLKVAMDYNAETKSCTLHFTQSQPSRPELTATAPLLIPVEVGLLDQKGDDIPLRLEGEDQAGETTRVLRLVEHEQAFTFVDIETQPVPSLLRDFSAPVRLEYDYSDADYIFLMGHDSDAFNRWEASQQLAMKTLLRLLVSYEKSEPLGLSHEFIEAFQKVLLDDDLDYALRAEALTLPSEAEIAEEIHSVDPAAIHAVRDFMQKNLAMALRLDVEALYEHLNDERDYRIDAGSIGRRRLRNVCVEWLAYIEDESVHALCYSQFSQAKNMTDVLAALSALSHIDCPERQQALKDFHEQWKSRPLVMDKWFSLQAMSQLEGTLDQVKALMEHELFDIRNPNKVRALIGIFCGRNPLHFHAEDGSGYEFLRDQVLQLDRLNPQIAARLVRPLMKWRDYESGRSVLMKDALEAIAAEKDLSADVYEIVSKSLQKG